MALFVSFIFLTPNMLANAEMKVNEEKSGDAMIVEETINKDEELNKEENVRIDDRYENENIDYSENVEEDDVMLESQESVHIKSENQLQGIKIERNEKEEDRKEVGDGIKNENVIVEEEAVSIQKDENVSVDKNYKTGAGLGSDICFVFAGLLSLLIIVALSCWKKLLRIRPFQ